MRKVLVTGAGGNVGQFLAGHLFERGYDVVGLYRNRIPENGGYPLLKADIPYGFSFPEGVDTVVHVAAGLEGTASSLIKDNIEAAAVLLDLAEKHSVAEFIYCSTVSVFGETKGIVGDKSDIINPDCYGMTKYLSEQLVRESKIERKLIVRLPRMLGPFVNWEKTEGSGFLTMVKKILQGENVVCFIPNAPYNNFLHVADLGVFVDALLNNPDWEKEDVLLGAREHLTMWEILHIMKKSIGSESELAAEDKGKMPKCSLVDITKAQRMGFSPDHAQGMLQRFMQEAKRKWDKC